MKVKHSEIRLGWNGKPTLYFQVEAETELERDAMKALAFHQAENHMDKTKDIQVCTVEIDEKDGYQMRVWTAPQISQQAFADRQKGR